MSDEGGGKYLDRHRELAERWVFLYFLTGGVACLGLGLAWEWPRSLVWSSLAAWLLAAASLTADIAIAQVGGEVRHREFRVGPPPAGSSKGTEANEGNEGNGGEILLARIPFNRAERGIILPRSGSR